MGDDPTVAVTGLARQIPDTWPGAGPSGPGRTPFAGRPNAAEEDPGRLDVTQPWPTEDTPREAP